LKIGEAHSLTPVGTDTLSDRVYDRLSSALMTGEFGAGGSLTLKDAARLVGTSVMPVREAVRHLVAQHALILERNKAIRIPLLSSSEFQQLWQLRELLEGEACAQAATMISETEVGALSRLLSETLAAARAQEMRHLIVKAHEFFFRVYAATGNSILVSMIEGLWLRTGPLYHKPLSSVSHLSFIRKNLKNNSSLFEALRLRDPDAAREARTNDLRELAAWFRAHDHGILQVAAATSKRRREPKRSRRRNARSIEPSAR
jgi:DNA-binding GntR family transcriptional regulator